jgi:hypothetical protein
MNTNVSADRLFSLSASSTPRPALRAPRLLGAMTATPGFVMGNRAFMRAWAARRVARTLALAPFDKRQP